MFHLYRNKMHRYPPGSVHAALFLLFSHKIIVSYTLNYFVARQKSFQLLGIIFVDIFPEIFSGYINSVCSKSMLHFFGSNCSPWWPLPRYMLQHLQHVAQLTTAHE